MMPNLKTTAAVLAIGLVAYAAYAETVTVSTLYPSPYGTYQTLETTAATSLATASGNVGIGVPSGTTPAAKLQVHTATANTPNYLMLTNAATGMTATDGLLVGVDQNGATRLHNYENSPLVLATNNQTRMTIAGDGTVTVPGNTTFNGNLDVDGSAIVGTTLTLTTSTGGNANTGTLQVLCQNNLCYAVAVYS